MAVKTATPEMFTFEQAAVRLGCSVRTLQRLKAEGVIGYTTLPGVGSTHPGVRFTKYHIDAYLQTRNVARRPRRAV